MANIKTGICWAKVPERILVLTSGGWTWVRRITRTERRCNICAKGNTRAKPQRILWGSYPERGALILWLVSSGVVVVAWQVTIKN